MNISITPNSTNRFFTIITRNNQGDVTHYDGLASAQDIRNEIEHLQEIQSEKWELVF